MKLLTDYLIHMQAQDARAETELVACLLHRGFAGVLRIAHTARMDERQVRRSIAWLRKSGYLEGKNGARELQWPTA